MPLKPAEWLRDKLGVWEKDILEVNVRLEHSGVYFGTFGWTWQKKVLAHAFISTIKIGQGPRGVLFAKTVDAEGLPV